MQAYGHKRTDKLYQICLWLALLLFAAQCYWLYGSTARDDAFLSFWPAHTLASEGALLNYNGEQVEQSSTLLLTLWLGLLFWLLPSLHIPLLAWISSLIAASWVLLTCARLLKQDQAAVSAVCVLATLPGLLFWGNSGMETTLAAALFTCLLACVLRQADKPHPPFGQLIPVVTAAVLIRPEAAAVLLCFSILNAGALASTRLRRITSFLLSHYTIIICTLLTAVAVSVFRYHYFGDFFPQPVSAKHAPLSLGTFLKGLGYIIAADSGWLTRILIGGGVLAWLFAWLLPMHPKRLHILVAGNLLVSQLAFILATGGDWMEASRFLLPVLPAATLAIYWLVSPWRALPLLLTVILFGIGAGDSWQFVRTQSSGFAQWERADSQQHYLAGQTPGPEFSAAEHFTKDALRDMPQLAALKVLGERLVSDKPLEVMSIQMGFIPYHLAASQPGRWHFLDLRALSTPELTQCKHTAQFQRSDTGVRIGYDEFFKLLPLLEADCGVRKPDVVYDMGWTMRREVLQQAGYRFVYLETRSIKGRFAARGIGSELFIAVREELVKKAGLQSVHDSEPLKIITQLPVEDRPNIVLMIGDDISYDTYGFMGNIAARTPTLDQLAADGTVFTHVQTPSAFCRPTLGSFLTGRWPHQTRLHANNGVIVLPAGYPTVARLLQQNGYATFAGGKFWEDEPDLRGFDQFDTDDNHFARHNQDALWSFLDTYGGRKPFFVWWAPKLPHTPHEPPQAFLDRIDPASITMPPELNENQHAEYRIRQHNFLAMTLWMDDEIRKLLENLRDKNVLENTILVYLGDNGFSHRAESKSTPYELGIRTPMIVHWPEHVPARTITTPVSSMHLYATLLEMGGVKTGAQPSSQSLLPVLQNKSEPIAEPLFGASYQAVTMKTDPMPRPERDIFALHVLDGDWKYVLYVRDVLEANNGDLTIKSGMRPFPARRAGDEELFYLPEDPIELNNLVAMPDKSTHIEHYRTAVLEWWKATGGLPFDSARDCPKQPPALCARLAPVSAPPMR
jgi:arylsulfatase A-like enzyme